MARRSLPAAYESAVGNRRGAVGQIQRLTEAEAAFRALKNELSIRPLFHQKEPRLMAHVMVAFLGYALWVTLKHMLKHRPTIVPQPSLSGVNNAQPLSPMNEGSGRALHCAKRRYRVAHHRRSRDPFAPHHGTRHGTEIAPVSARTQPPSFSAIVV